ncbi:hypothetical protein D9M71_659250 [compost metagenome]
MLAVDVLKFGHLVLRTQAVIELVVDPSHVEMVGSGIAGVAFVLAMNADVLTVG